MLPVLPGMCWRGILSYRTRWTLFLEHERHVIPVAKVMHVLAGIAAIQQGRSELRNLVHCPGSRGKTPTSGTCSNVVIYGALRRQHAAWLLTLSAGCAARVFPQHYSSENALKTFNACR